jgi:hypothetical protein
MSELFASHLLTNLRQPILTSLFQIGTFQIGTFHFSFSITAVDNQPSFTALPCGKTQTPEALMKRQVFYHCATSASNDAIEFC